MKRRRQISGTADYIIPLGVVGLGAFLVYKFFGNGGQPGTGTGSNNAGLAAAVQQSTTATLQQQAAAGQQPTISAVQAQGIASAAFSLGMADPVDFTALNAQLTNVNNLSDLTLVIQYFGTKSINSSWYSACALLNISCTAVDLPSFVKLVYANNADQLGILNGFYSAQGINYQF